MNARVVTWKDLTAEELQVWRRLQNEDAASDSPFCSPEFTGIAANIRDAVRIGVFEAGRRPVGFFPFQLGSGRRAVPVAAGFSEFHGPVFTRAHEYSVDALLEACDLVGWSYDHLPVCNERFAPFHQRIGESPFLDLSSGFETFRDKKQAESSVIAQAERKIRKLEREIGAVRFRLHDASEASFQRLLQWKSAQHLRTGVVDVFQQAWVVNLLRQVRDANTEHFRGLFSVLTVGGSPVAVHLGMSTSRVAHMWYPAYDPRLAAYSPGNIMLLRLARALADEGIERFDLGPGGQPYKERLMSGSLPVAIGYAERSRLKSAMRRRFAKTKQWARSQRDVTAERFLTPMRRWFAAS